MMHSDEQKTRSFSRRDLLNQVPLAGLVALATGVGARDVLAATDGAEPDMETLRKVLIERLVNTRYYIATDGSIVVLAGDEVWPGSSGGAYHADWLFNSVDGLKADPNTALEQTVLADSEHTGIPEGWDLSSVQAICSKAEETGLLDDMNLVYHVLREKIRLESEGAHEQGVVMFDDWVSASPDYTQAEKDTISAAVTDYLNQAYAQTEHEWY